MAQPRLVALANRVRQYVESYFDGKPAQLNDLLVELLLTILTAEVQAELQRLAARRHIHGLKTHLGRLSSFLQKKSVLPEAICARYEYNQSQRRVKRTWGITDTEWRYVHDLSRETHSPIDQLYLDHDFTQYEWHDALEEDIIFLDVLLEARAIEDLLIPVMEGYLSPKAGTRKGYEVFGICLGMLSERSEERRGSGLRYTQYVHIMRCEPQLSADGAHYWVMWNERSIDALLDAARILFPSYELIGDFRSHAYGGLADVTADRGWMFSDGDEADLLAWAHHMRDVGQKPVISLVAAIARSERAVERSHYQGRRNTLQMSVGNCRVVIGAYRVLGSGSSSDRNIRLRAAGMVR